MTYRLFYFYLFIFFHERVESIQYNGVLAITGALRVGLRERLSRTRLRIPTATMTA